MIGDGQKIIDPRLNPHSPGDIIAARALAVPAVFDIIHDLVLPRVQSLFCPEIMAVLPEDVANVVLDSSF